jgi:hypothetical protein
MSIKKKILRLSVALIFMALVFHITPGYSQSGLDLRINEILVHNDSNYVDDYGNRSSWIEIFNSAYNNVNIGGMYLTNDPGNPRKYRIPTGDPLTSISSRNYLVFFADNHPTRGILHVNFTLKDTNYIALYDVNGKTLIDEITFPPQEPDVTYGRATDGAEEWIKLEKSTPNANNYTGVTVTAGEKFVVLDPYGVGLALTAMSVVFTGLLLLYLVFKNTRRIYAINLRKVFSRSEKIIPAISEDKDVSGEVNAAIAMALHLYQAEYHDHEEAVLTIKKVARTYSPWSSKIYTLRRSPR